MHEEWYQFESIVRRANRFTEARSTPIGGQHPFQERNIHQDIEKVAKKLFDDGHYAQATFEAYKFIDKQIQSRSGLSTSGYKLMMDAFNELSPKIKLNSLLHTSDKDEQMGFKFLFSGTVMAIRNPRGHEYDIKDTVDDCLDHLSLASMLQRKLEKAVT